MSSSWRAAATSLCVVLVVLIAGAGTARAQQYEPGDGAVQVSDSSPASGDAITVSGDGFAPDSQIIITIESVPQELGRTNADAQGEFSMQVTIPAGLSGVHTIRATGEAPDGSVRVLALSVTVSPVGGTVPRTGSEVLPLALAGAVAVIVGAGLVRRSRRRTTAA